MRLNFPKSRWIVAIVLALAGMPSTASAVTYTYVGSWRVDDGRPWYRYPKAYTGLEAAVYLFGGALEDYAISTKGIDPAYINRMAWYGVLGVLGGHMLPQDYDVSLPGDLYFDGSAHDGSLAGNPASALVTDNAIGAAYTNYAFRIEPDVLPALPLPASLPILAGSFGSLMLFRRPVHGSSPR